ncbi:acyltransferase family protein [Peribacillus sp. FSL H8-0477]|uniref:acyltransferase family protein n=1 Tax=Peribacillus sp. FSL H8-0477 TaxID=2921388 RepID=UPI0030FB4985
MNKRSYYFDNAKFILMGFVVFGHLLNSFINDNELIYALYKTIYTFHMPAFILVSGFFAKGYYKKGYLAKITKKLILPYIIFQVIYTVFYYFLYRKDTFQLDLFDPNWALWFLISLFCWNIMLLGFAKLKPLLAITLSILIALLIGYVDWVSNYLSLSRTFVFFPMFLIGYHLSKNSLQKLFSTKIRVTSLLIMVIVFAFFYLMPDINYKWLLGSKPYSELEQASLISMFKRLGFYGLSVLMTFCFLSFIPKEKHFFTNWGTQTLYVYLLHGFLVRTFRESEMQSYFTNVESFLLLGCLSLIITMILSSRLTASLAQPIIELKVSRTIGLVKNIRHSFHTVKKQIDKLANN